MAEPREVNSQMIAMAAMKLLQEDTRFKIGEAEIRGNTYRVFENAPSDLTAIFGLGATHGDKPFLIFNDETLSFAETFSRARRFGDGLRKTMGVGVGDRVALAMRNYPEWCIAYMGVISIGAVVVPLNAWWKTDEMAFALKDCGAKIVIADSKRRELLEPVTAELGLEFIIARDEVGKGVRSTEEIERAGDESAPQTNIDTDSDFAIYYTSGSTGRPKGVILTHRGAISTLMSWSFLASALKEARGGVGMFGDDPGVLLAIPLFHVTGSHAIFLLSFMVGRRIVMQYRWDAKDAANLIRKHKLTNFVGVPSQSYELIDAAGDEGLPSLVDISAGGAKRPPEHVRKLKETFKTSNPSTGYGLSETNALGTIGSLVDYQKKPDSCGRPVPPLCDIKIVGDDGDCKPGEVGEICIRSAANFRGYLNLPEDTQKALTPDGWFRTGDLGKVDEEGFVYIVDRIKDLIIRGGENISCLEVEARAYEHPQVAEAVVFSVPDDVLGERVGLVVYPKEGGVDAAALREFMGAGLAGFKTPERIWVSPASLPRLGTAKFDKITIRKIALGNAPALAV